MTRVYLKGGVYMARSRQDGHVFDTAITLVDVIRYLGWDAENPEVEKLSLDVREKLKADLESLIEKL